MAFDKPQSRNEAILQNMLGANNELEPPKSRVEALLQDIAGQMPEANPSEGTTTGTLERLKIGDEIYTVEGGGSGTSDYDALNNKPQIAGVTLSGDKSLADLGIASASAVSDILNGTDIDSFGDVETALAGKQGTLTFDSAPTSESTNPVTSGGVYTALAGKVDKTSVGVASGVAELDSNGKVPSAQLPSYVDDVVNGYLHDGKFYADDQYTTEITGEEGKIYVDLATNKTYRWSGLAFVEISESLALGETSSTAYAGDKGKANADAISAIKDGQTIDSFADVETALAGKADLTDLAPAFSTATAYTVGQYVSYGGDIYKCTSAHSAGAWAAGDFTLVAVGSELESKQDTLTFDDTPTQNSTNPVKSGGVYSVLGEKADTDIVASDFDATASYTAGNYCIYEGKFYKFKANHSGAWSAADVDEIKIAGELASLKSGLTSYQEQNDLNLEVPNRKNLCDNGKNGVGYYDQTGTYLDSVHYATSDLIPVEQGKTYVASIFNKTTSERIGGLVYSTWDASKNFVAQSTSASITVGSGVSYVRIRNFQDQTSFIDNDNYVYQLEQGSTATAYAPYIPSVESRIEAVESGLSGIKSVSETITLGAVLAGNLVQITINGVSTKPKAIYIKDSSKGFPIIAANFWVSNNVLTIQVYNVSVADRTEGDIECVLIYC